MPRFRRHNMAEGLVSSNAFCELVDLGSVKVRVKLRTLRLTVLTMLLAMSVILKSLDPLRSLKHPGLASLSSFGKDRPLMSLRASGLLRPLMRPGRSELRSSNWSLRSLALMRSLGILISFLFLSWLELPVFSSFFSFREDSVNNGRSNDAVSPVRHVSSGNNEGRLDDHSGSNDVSARLISVSNRGGIEEPQHRAGETPGPSTVISHGTDGLESFFQSVSVPLLWQVVDEWVVDEWGNCGNWKKMLEEFDLEKVLSNTPSYSDLTPSYSDQLTKIKNNVRSEFPRLLQLRERNPSLSPEDLKVYCVLLCWSSKKRVDFWSHLSDELLLRADEPKKLMLELERTWQPHCGEKRNDKIVDELLSRVDELKKLMLELERTWQLHFGDFGGKRNDKIDELLLRVDELLPRADELKELRLELERTWQLHFGEKWNDKIDEEWIEKFGEKDWRPHFGEKWIDKIDEKWIKKNGKKWIDRIDEEWIRSINHQYRPYKSEQTLGRGLLRFVRNRWHHPDKFMKSHGLRRVEPFYNHLDERFPNFLMVSYGVAYRFCREEPWFENYR